MHHRFSEPVKKWSETAGDYLPAGNRPEKRSIEYYAQLAHHDRLRRGRGIVESNESMTFSDGNSTFRISSLGFLHYATITLGTPGMKFLVALDTGSDLFWVPCECRKCAPTEGKPYGSDFELSINNPKESSTSKNVSCYSSLCPYPTKCLGTFNHCPYMVSYVSSETSTSGILVEDVLHLKAEDRDQESVQAYITFGCGRVQTGSFLDVAAPNGLFGLGFDKISVPSILSSEGYTADSFSMCFGQDGTGRISFGDKGSSEQEQTPFNVDPLHPTYNITVTQSRVGTTLIDLDLTALFDTGTSFTYVVDPAYSRFSESFHSQVKDRRRPPDPRIPFEYCYDMSPDANTSLIPTVSLTMKGGGQFALSDPIIVISTQHELIYCLAFIRSAELNIIGQNFMTGYRVVFDKEKLILGWKKSNCYDIDDANSILARSHNSTTAPPAVAAGLGTWTPRIPTFTHHYRYLRYLSSSLRRRLWLSPLKNAALGHTHSSQFSFSEGFGTFGFDVHHRYSDKVKGILDLDGLPEKGSVDYYAAMVHRDHLLRGRHLAETTAAAPAPLTFSAGNETFQIGLFGYLYYANVTVGSPGLSFLVALDTGSDLFWLPCDCTSCIRGVKFESGQVVEFNIYSPNTSSTSEAVSCNSTFCEQPRQCSSRHNTCVYQVQYLSDNTSSTGLVVEDILRLTTDDSQLKVIDAQVPLGCGIVQTGSFLEGAAPNGLFGLGMDDISVPSVLSSQGLTANSFSMCFGPNETGRISFGDTGDSVQGQTPFNVVQPHPTYNVTVTKVSVGNNVTDISFNAIFDSGTSFTNLNNPAYTIISKMFDSQAKETRHSSSDSQIPFEYCYDLSANQSKPPPLNLTMKGGDQFSVTAPIVEVSLQKGMNVYCLALVKSEDINIIGQNFMTGYSIVFDRENMVLGWEASNCYDTESSTTLYPPESSAVPPTALPPTTRPPTNLNPEATTQVSPTSSLSPPNDSTRLKSGKRVVLTRELAQDSSHVPSGNLILIMVLAFGHGRTAKAQAAASVIRSPCVIGYCPFYTHNAADAIVALDGDRRVMKQTCVEEFNWDSLVFSRPATFTIHLHTLTVVWGFNYSCCEGFGTFGFDVHHRYSDKMKGILDVDGLPEKGSVDYYATMAHRDHLLRGRHLAATTTAAPAPLTFSGGNKTYNIASFGYCGIVETGAFLEGLAPNGLFGLGMNDISVPSVLANKGLTANSFSMCFGTDGYGRMNFGDTGSSGQGQTPFNVEQSNPTYNVTVTQVSVGNNVTDISFTAIFNSGTSFTNLNDPSYTIISEMFDSQANETRHSSSDSQIPFEYCYDLSSNQSSLEPPPVNLTMKGGDQFYVIAPTVIVSLQNGGNVYCLALVKSWDINIIGQNFMTGYSIVFDSENMVLGWEASNCYGTESSVVAPAALSPEAPSHYAKYYFYWRFFYWR
ncbi:hypothetical protein Vadar_004773 [Vaccinium darrowii]|uniref:Uncharacterized protein n=1 Tax=Vaccinium darrowii TaxID=229202 RepID=A0ACB7Y4X6_9ERIC|nr:hypothetical protein Vadar_004773 [Vaccinium darrowii]